jgi:hypothetical protein
MNVVDLFCGSAALSECIPHNGAAFDFLTTHAGPTGGRVRVHVSPPCQCCTARDMQVRNVGAPSVPWASPTRWHVGRKRLVMQVRNVGAPSVPWASPTRWHVGRKRLAMLVCRQVLVVIAASLSQRLHPAPHWESPSGSEKVFLQRRSRYLRIPHY